MADESSIHKRLKEISDIIDVPYVVEDVRTGEKYVTSYFEAIDACYYKDSDPYYDIWTSSPKPNMKMYKLSDLGPAGEVLYGPKKP